MKHVKIGIRAGLKERGAVRIRMSDSAIVFTTSTGQKIEVDLQETEGGGLLLRSHTGKLAMSQHDGTLVVSAGKLV